MTDKETAERIAADLAARDARSASLASLPVAERIAADNAARDSLAHTFARYTRALADMAPNNLSAHAMHTLDNRACDLRGHLSDLLEARGVNTVPEYLEHAGDAVERAIAARLVADALAHGCLVSVCDGEEWTVKQSRDAHAILAAMASTESDTLKFRNADGDTLGSVWLIYGNGHDLISDYSAPRAEFLAVIKGAEDLAETFAARA